MISPDRVKYETRCSLAPRADTRPISGLFGSATTVNPVVSTSPSDGPVSPGNGENTDTGRRRPEATDAA